MPYDDKIAARIRAVLAARLDLDVVEKKMFGGLCFMVGGHMCCGLAANTLMLRVGPDACPDALAQPHARPMTFTGRPLAGFVYVDPPGYRTTATLSRWLDRGLAFVASLPPKAAKPRKPRPRPDPTRRR
jgi:TfoX/Sxy family transcriptional regulator of competence genes